ncbi:MAG: CBS domain-containing protein, partial [Deferrisomatales bacterium]
MGYQLWKSAATGYRRRGTRVGDLRALFEDRIAVDTIYEPIESCLGTDSAETVREHLRERDFDVAGVQDRREAPVIGYVRREELGPGRVEHFLHRLTPQDLISEATPLADLLAVLRERDHVFVLRRSDVSGIVTRADLNKPPVRIFLFGLISLFEMHVGYWCQQFYASDAWQEKLSKGRLAHAWKLRQLRAERNQDTGLFDCLQFLDKCELLLRHPDLCRRLQLASKSKSRSVFTAAESLRN